MNAQDLVAPVAMEIRDAADTIEADRKLPDALMKRLVEAGLFAIYTPQEFGGLEFSLPQGLRVVEEVSRHDGSTGWTVALGFANCYFTSVVSADVARRLMPNGSALIAGGPGFTVQARPVEGGYRLTGQWPFGSGAPNATWMSVAAPIVDEDGPRIGPAGPEMVFAFIPPEDVEIIDTWHVSGMRGTGSHDLRVEDLFVPAELTGSIAIPGGVRPVRPSAATRIPFTTLLGAVQAPAVCLGIASRAVEEFRVLAVSKERPFAPRLSEQVQAHVGLAHAEALIRSARAYFYQAIEAVWDAASHGREVSLAERANTRMAALTAAENSCAAVDTLFRLSGSSVIFNASPLERCWRDVHTTAQHMQVQDARWETAGRVIFGLEPNNPFI